MPKSKLYSNYNFRIKRIKIIRIKSLKFLAFSMLLLLGFKAESQSLYTIKIQNNEYSPKTNFLKMGTNHALNGDKLSYTDRYLTKNGKPWYPVMGEMHFSRCEAKHWEESIFKMKAAGIEIISTYIIWIHIEEIEGKMDWTGNNNLREFIKLCQKHGVYVWLRPGPWVHAEVRNGGFPDWLMNKGIKLRSNDPEYLKYTQKWFNVNQPGPLYGYSFYNLPDQVLYNLTLKTATNAIVTDWIADIEYDGDMLAIYEKDSLIYDQFNYNKHCKYKISYAGNSPEKQLKLQLFPLKKSYDIYVEDGMKNNDWGNPKIKNINMLPVYSFKLNFD